MTNDIRLSPAGAARLDALFREYNDFVLRLAFAQLRDADRAQDLAQSAWLSVIPTLARGEAIARPTSFLATVVRRRAMDYRDLAAVRRERAADWSDAMASRALPAAPPADEDALAFGELSTPQATVLKLTAKGLSQRDIARRLGKTRQAVQQNQQRGAHNLRLAMAA